MGKVPRQGPEIPDKLFAFLSNPTAIHSSFLKVSGIAGFDADSADVVTEVQAFLELAEWFVALYVIEFRWVFRDGGGRAEFDAFMAIAAVFLHRTIGS